MSLYRTLETIAAKLDITQPEMQVLYCYTKIGANRWGMLNTLRILNKLIAKHDLLDSQFEKSYGDQLEAKGILNAQEAKFFDSTEIEDGLDLGITRAEPGSDRDHETTQGVTDPRVPRKRQPKGKRGRKTPTRSPKRSKQPTVPA